MLQLPVTKYLWINLYWVSIKLCTIELKQKETSSWKVHYPNRGVHNILFFVNIMVCHVVSCLEHKSPVLYTCSGMWNFMRKTLEVLSCPVVWLDCENNMGEKVAKCLYFNGLQFSCFLMNFPLIVYSWESHIFLLSTVNYLYTRKIGKCHGRWWHSVFLNSSYYYRKKLPAELFTMTRYRNTLIVCQQMNG